MITPYTIDKAKKLETTLNSVLGSIGRVTLIKPGSAQPSYKGPIKFNLGINWKWANQYGSPETVPISIVLEWIGSIFRSAKYGNYSLDIDNTAEMLVTDNTGSYKLIFNLPNIPGETRMSKTAIFDKPRKRRGPKTISEADFLERKEDAAYILENYSFDAIQDVYHDLKDAFDALKPIERLSPEITNVLQTLGKMGNVLEKMTDSIEHILDTTLPNAKMNATTPTEPKPF